MTGPLGLSLSNVLDRRARFSAGASAVAPPAPLSSVKGGRAASLDVPRISFGEMPVLEGSASTGGMPPLRTAMRSTDGTRPRRLSVRIEERPVSVIIVPPRPDTPPALPARLLKKLSSSFAGPRGVRGPIGSIRR